MPTPRETILQALLAVLQTVPGPTVLRGDVLPERIPAGGLLILRDGDPGTPEVTMSPLQYHYEHRAEVEVIVQGKTPAARAAAFDALVQNIGVVLAADRKSTRGGRITPGEWERRRGLRLRFVYRRTGPGLLVAEGRLNTKGQAVASRSKTGRGKITAPIFLLVPQVGLPKQLDLARDAARAVGAAGADRGELWRGRFDF